MATRISNALDKVGAQMLSVFNPDDLTAAKAAIVRCLTAERKVRAGRDDQGKVIYEIIPDYPTQLAAGCKVVEWTIGKPIARTVDLTPDKPNGANGVTEDLLALLLATPEPAIEILSKLQQAALKIKKTDAVEIVVSPEIPENPAPPESSSEGFPR